MCKKLFEGATNGGKLECPIHIYPKCHPRSYVEAFVDLKKREVILCCHHCEGILDRIKVRQTRKKTT